VVGLRQVLVIVLSPLPDVVVLVSAMEPVDVLLAEFQEIPEIMDVAEDIVEIVLATALVDKDMPLELIEELRELGIGDAIEKIGELVEIERMLLVYCGPEWYLT
jgi:hypothetical protein